jgi:fibronectin-binding autotransporter adhesin
VWQYADSSSNPGDADVFNGTATQLTNTLVIGKAIPAPPSGVTVYWDPSFKDASPGSGGAGTWDNSSTNWWLSGTVDVVWSAAGDYAVFAGTAATVTLGADVGADGLAFNTPGYVIAGSDTLTLNGTTPVISVPPGSPTYIDCVLGGSGYELTGGGVLVLENAGNYCGSSSSAEFVNGPNTCLVVLTDHDTGNDGVTLNLENGGIYQDNDTTSGDQFLLPGCAIALLSGGGIFDNPNASLTMSNYITGPGSLTYTGYTNSSGTPYVLTLTHTGNNYSGGTIVQGPGELKANAAGTLGATSGSLTVSGGTLDLGGASHTVGTVTISGGKIQDGTLTGSSYAGTSAGAVSAVLAGSGALVLNASPTITSGNYNLTLSGANTYTGTTTINAGILQISSDANLGTPPGSALANSLTLNCYTTNGLRCGGTFTLNANRGITLGAKGGSLHVSSGNTVTYNGIITGSGNFSSGAGDTLGYGTLQLSGANNYSGATTVAAGTLQLGANGTLPYGTPLTIASDQSAGSSLDLNGFSQTVGPLQSSAGIGGTGTKIPCLKLTSGGALTVLQTNISTTFAGIINGSGSLTVAVPNGGTPGTLTLGGGYTNTYSGATTVSAGTLAIGSGTSISNTTSINIAAGAAFDVSAITSYALSSSTALSASGTSSAATIKGASAGTVSLGSRPITLTYDGSHPALYLSQGTLQLQGNTWTVNASSALAAGAYTIAQQAGGNIISSSGTPTVSGTAIGSGKTASIQVSGANVNLVILENTTTALSRTTGSSSQTYGGTLTFTATVTGNGTTPGGNVIFKDGSTPLATNALSSGTAVYTSDTALNVSGSPHSLAAYYQGDSTHNTSDSSASPISQIITAQALTAGLTGTVSKTYDGTTAATLAAGNYTLPGVVSGDTVTLNNPTSGTYDTKNVGSGKTVSVTGLAISGLSAGNYTLSSTSTSGVIGVITALTTSCWLTSSVNPSGPGTNVTFTAVVNGVPPAADLPTGTVVFSANGAPLATNALVGGGISASTASLPLGTNALMAQYLGDGNFLGSTGSVAQVVELFVTCSQTNALLSVADNLDGAFTLTFVGTPQAEYYVLASPDVAAPMTRWVPVVGSTNTVTNVSGLWQFTVTNTAPQQFYRSTAVVPCP